MSLQTVANKFVELCNQGKNFDVMKTMYADDIVSVESTGAETKNKGPVIEKSAKWAGGLELHGEKVQGPFFSGNSQFAVTFEFDVTPKSTGKRQKQFEVAVYSVNANDLIFREQFLISAVGDEAGGEMINDSDATRFCRSRDLVVDSFNLFNRRLRRFPQIIKREKCPLPHLWESA